jgi:hypothetical protein
MNPRLFEWYARRVWPLHRLAVRGLARRCRRCVISERCTPLDRGGLCPACADPAAIPAIAAPPADPAGMQRRLDRLLADAATATDRYHAALMLSGGKDSAYILWRLRSAHPALRILCLAVDNGFMAPGALANCTRAAARTGADLLVLGAHTARFAGTLRAAFLGLRGRGTYGVVDDADGSLIFALGREAAAALGIPLLLSGLSWVQLQRIVGLGGDRFTLGEGGAPPLEVFPLAVWRTDEREIRAAVRRQGLVAPGHDSPLATNSALVLPMGVVDMLTLGYSSFEPEFAQLAREGKTDRRLWRGIFESLEHGVRSGRLVAEADRVLERLGLDVAQVVRASAGGGT